MGQTIVEKIFEKYAGKAVAPGEIVSVPFHRLIFMETKGAAIFKYFEKDLGQTKLKNPDRIVMVCDHLGLGHNLADAQIIEHFRRKAKEYNVKRFYDTSCGIGHQIMVEDGLVAPGTISLGCDSHSTTYGAVGAFSCGITPSETAVALATDEIWLMVPATVQIQLTGKLPFGCSGKDVALKIISLLKADKYALYKAVEIVGEGVSSLSMDDRIVICNMMAETGAKSGLIPVDDVTREFLKGRLDGPCEAISSDKDAKFSRTFSIDLKELTPMVAPPDMVDDAKSASEFEGVPITNAFLGSCASGRLEDLAVAATLLKGRKIPQGVTMIVAPASQKIYIEAAKLGYLQIFAEAGAAVATPDCATCSGAQSGVLPDGAVSVSASNRNSTGRMGSPLSSVYLASAATVAASALKGSITDPRQYLKQSSRGGES